AAGYLGGFFGEPLQLVRCRTVDLEVPASAEIVVEGHLAVDETARGEYSRDFPMYHVSAITHRDNPILPVSPAGEDQTVAGVSYSAMALRLLRDEGLPVAGAWSVPEAAGRLLVITVSKDWPQRAAMPAAELCRRIGLLVKKMHGGQRITRLMVCE